MHLCLLLATSSLDFLFNVSLNFSGSICRSELEVVKLTNSWSGLASLDNSFAPEEISAILLILYLIIFYCILHSFLLCLTFFSLTLSDTQPIVTFLFVVIRTEWLKDRIIDSYRRLDCLHTYSKIKQYGFSLLFSEAFLSIRIRMFFFVILELLQFLLPRIYWPKYTASI